MEMVLLIVYALAGIWAANRTIYANKTFIEFKPGSVFIRKFTVGLFLGWALIPIAIIKTIFMKK